jgi:MinD superfamily P-loop ATPase
MECIAQARHISILGKVPYDTIFSDAQAHCQSIIEYSPQSQASEDMRHIWHKLETGMK